MNPFSTKVHIHVRNISTYCNLNLPNIVYALDDKFHQEYMIICYCWQLKLVEVDNIYALVISVDDFCYKKEHNISKTSTFYSEIKECYMRTYLKHEQECFIRYKTRGTAEFIGEIKPIGEICSNLNRIRSITKPEVRRDLFASTSKFKAKSFKSFSMSASRFYYSFGIPGEFLRLWHSAI